MSKIMMLRVTHSDLVSFVRFKFKKHEKYPWRSVTFTKVARACNFTKRNTPVWLFFMFMNCANGTKSRKASHIFLHFTSISL